MHSFSLLSVISESGAHSERFYQDRQGEFYAHASSDRLDDLPRRHSYMVYFRCLRNVRFGVFEADLRAVNSGAMG